MIDPKIKIDRITSKAPAHFANNIWKR